MPPLPAILHYRTPHLLLLLTVPGQLVNTGALWEIIRLHSHPTILQLLLLPSDQLLLTVFSLTLAHYTRERQSQLGSSDERNKLHTYSKLAVQFRAQGKVEYFGSQWCLP